MNIRVGIIGAGGIAAKLHLPEMQTVPDAAVTLISGRRESRLKTLSRKFDVERCTHDYAAVVADPDIDAVIISLPHPLHVEWGLAAISAGKHVYMQKPLSTSLDEADRFVAAAEATDRTVFALPYVARPHLLASRQMATDGSLGTVSSARARNSHGGPEVYYAGIQEILEEEPEDSLWFFDAERADVGALFDMGVYAIANLVAVLGAVTAVTARLTTAAKPTQLEDTAAVLLDFDCGALGVAETGWCDAARTGEFSIHGTAGKLVGSTVWGRDGGVQLSHHRPGSQTDEDATQLVDPVDLSVWPDENSHQHWINCIRRGGQPELSNARTARHITEIMLAALTSSRAGRTIAVNSRV